MWQSTFHTPTPAAIAVGAASSLVTGVLIAVAEVACYNSSCIAVTVVGGVDIAVWAVKDALF